MDLMPTISAIVLTFNEERHIFHCLESIKWCEEIWVVDSFSTDRTLEICQHCTTKIVKHPFENFAKQRNWALDNLPLSGEWILLIDADQRITPELQDEILSRLIQDQGRFAGYYIPKRQYFWGQPLRFGGTSPLYDIELFQKGKGRFQEDKIVHECLVLDGKAGFLKQPKIMIAKDSLFEYIDRLNWYSNLEAIRMLKTGQELYTTASASHSRKNQVLKFVFKYLPFKPIANFLFLYIVQQGFRDGYRGYLYAVMQSFYVFASYAKLWELKTGLVRPAEMTRRR